MRAELRQRRRDLAHSLVDRASHVLARALGWGCRGAVAAAEADRAGQLARDEVQLLLGPRRALVVRPVARLVELLAQRLNASPIGGLGLRIEPRTCTGRIVRRQLGAVCAGGARCALGNGNELERVDLGAGVLEQHRELRQSLGVLQPRLAPAIPERPMVALAPQPVACVVGHGCSSRV